MGIWATSHGSPMRLYRTWSRARCRPTSVKSSEVCPLLSLPLPSVLRSDNYTGIGQTMQPSLSSSQGTLGVLFMKQRSVECRSFSLSRTTHSSSAGLRSCEQSLGSLVPWAFQSWACTRGPDSPSVLFSTHNLEDLPSFHIRRP